jgi:hypothetical protein
LDFGPMRDATPENAQAPIFAVLNVSAAETTRGLEALRPRGFRAEPIEYSDQHL